MDGVVKEYSLDDEYTEVYFDSYGYVVGSSTGDTMGTFTREAISALDFDEYSDVISGDVDEYTGYFAVFQRLDIDVEFICGADKIGALIYQYPYSGAGSYSTYYTDYLLILESYQQNTALVPTSEKVYKRISIKTMF